MLHKCKVSLLDFPFDVKRVKTLVAPVVAPTGTGSAPTVLELSLSPVGTQVVLR